MVLQDKHSKKASQRWKAKHGIGRGRVEQRDEVQEKAAVEEQQETLTEEQQAEIDRKKTWETTLELKQVVQEYEQSGQVGYFEFEKEKEYSKVYCRY